jgi:hypothetical protein
MGGSRLRDSRPAEEESRRELVVSGEERSRAVQDLRAQALELRQLSETGLDAIERRQDVDTPDCDVASRDSGQLVPMYEPRSVPELSECGDESAVRVGRLSEDDDRARAIRRRLGWRNVCPSAGFDRGEARGHHDTKKPGRSKKPLRTT